MCPKSFDDLHLTQQVKIRSEDFMAAGRDTNEAFDSIYRKLRKLKGDRGLSNSEAALSAGLWGAHQCGADISHIGLARYFPATGELSNVDELRKKVLAADAFLLSTPVYFGDRSSMAQEFIEFLREDPICREQVHDKLYGGIAVGAKRNGGQETTLVYQMVDFSNLNMLCIGNDSETTSQYGGTAHAGDVGTLHLDDYGINTSLGTGRRLGRVLDIYKRGLMVKLKEPIRIRIFLLQDDSKHRGQRLLQDFCNTLNNSQKDAVFELCDYTEDKIYRCIACDICPTHMGVHSDYRCIITSSDDLFKKEHENIVQSDAILLAAYSPTDRQDIHSVYQRFIERTRYLRRDDYVFGNKLVAPFVISEIDSSQNLHIRMLTSLIRHHTVLHKPLIAYEMDGELLNWNTILTQGVDFAMKAAGLVAGELAMDDSEIDNFRYNPVGYVISSAKEEEDSVSGIRAKIENQRRTQHQEDRKKRLGQRIIQ